MLALDYQDNRVSGGEYQGISELARRRKKWTKVESLVRNAGSPSGVPRTATGAHMPAVRCIVYYGTCKGGLVGEKMFHVEREKEYLWQSGRIEKEIVNGR